MVPTITVDSQSMTQKIIKMELLDMERAFNVKKEQFLKIQGALEALNAVKANNSETDAKSAK